ncbi:MAG: FG-GAP and VCBS repeat-containing protein [Candidatus Kapaibacterium sp.]|nr:VCBS repeat-containing protein [Bacteroidota bacterium]
MPRVENKQALCTLQKLLFQSPPKKTSLQVGNNNAMFGATELPNKRNRPAMLVIKAITIVLVLLCLPHTTHAQDYSKLPELPVWYELENTSFGKNMTYLPNFDTARGGMNAFIPYFSANTPTIYNRYKGDTENMFNWGARAAHLMGDFNGDGIQDFYFQSTCSFYVGKKNGVPPDTPEVKSYYNDIRKNGFNVGYFKGDFDNDGKEDVLVSSDSKPTKEYNIGSIIFGNADLSKMQVVNLPHTNDAGLYQECIIDAYTNNGKARMITMTWDNNRSNSSLHIWEIRFITSGVNVKVEYQKLSTQFLSSGNSESFPLGIKSFHLYNNTQHSLLWIGTLYNLDNDNFEKLWFRSQTTPKYKIPVSIPDLKFPGWITISLFSGYDLCFGGDPRTNPNPIAKIPEAIPVTPDDKLYTQNISSVGDVNHDGLGDIAVFYDGTEHSLFRIYLGVVGTVGVTEQDTLIQQPSISITAQNTILTKQDNIRVQVTVQQHGTYTIDLYAMDGKKITTLWSGALHQGETDIPLQPLPPTLAAGRYNIMIDNGTQFNVCGVIVQ